MINNNPDGININTDCGSTHIGRLQAFVKEHGLDVGFAYDGDADRCLAVDENGRIIDGDVIMYVCGSYMKSQGQLPYDTVVTTVMSNMGLYEAFEQEGIRYETTAVGDKYVGENMRANGYGLGGEESGHIIFSKHAVTGDGILTSLKIMEAMLEQKSTLSKLAEPVTIFPKLLQNIRVKDKDTVLNDSDIKDAVAKAEEYLGTEGRMLFRASGTEPLIRVMAEARSEELAQKGVAIVIDKIKEKGYEA